MAERSLTMWVRLGNADAIETLRDDEGRLCISKIEGQQVTSILLPEGLGIQEALATVLAVIPCHFADGAQPQWIESSSSGLKKMLDERFKLKGATRPVGWGGSAGKGKGNGQVVELKARRGQTS